MQQRMTFGVLWVVLGTLLVAADTQEPMGPGEDPESSPHDALEWTIPHERPSDPYLAPSMSRATSLARPIVRDGFVSVQVNVNAHGENLLGDAANEPSIAVDPTDPESIVIGWRQFDNVASNFRQAGWAYSHDGGQTWTFPGVLEDGVFRSDPVLGSDADGNFYYYSLTVLRESPDFNEYWADLFKSVDGGVTWLSPVNGFGGDKQWMTIDRTTSIGRGNIYGNWNVMFTCCAPDNDFTRSIDGGTSFEAPIPIPEPKMRSGTLDVGPDGELYLAGSTLNRSGHVVARSSNAKDPREAPAFDFVHTVELGGTTARGGINPGGLLGQVWIATDHSSRLSRGFVYVLGSVNPPGPDPLDVMFVRSIDGGETWSAPVRVNDDSTGSRAWQWFGTMSVAPNGRIDAVWNDTGNDPENFLSEVFYSFSTDAGLSWSTNVPLSPPFDPSLGYPQQDKIGDYYHLVSDDTGASLAYAATFNGEQDVYFLRITPDQQPPAADLDHFMSYRIRRDRAGPRFYRFGPLRLSDQFGSANYEIKRQAQLLLPADKDAEGVFDEVTHLEEYRIKTTRGTPRFAAVRNVRILNQCSDFLLEVKKPTSLLVPTTKSLSDPVEAPDSGDHMVDHFLCHRVRHQRRLNDGTKLPRFPKGTQVMIEDQFQTRRYDLKKITKLCSPVAKDEDPSTPSMILAGPEKGTPFAIQPAAIGNPDRHLVCYRAKLASREIPQNGCGCDTTVDERCRGVKIDPRQARHVKKAGLHTNNQFGPELLKTVKEVEFCVPSLMSHQEPL